VAVSIPAGSARPPRPGSGSCANAPRAPLACAASLRTALFPVLGFFKRVPVPLFLCADHFQYLAQHSAHPLFRRRPARLVAAPGGGFPAVTAAAMIPALANPAGAVDLVPEPAIRGRRTLYRTTIPPQPCLLDGSHNWASWRLPGHLDEGVALFRKSPPAQTGLRRGAQQPGHALECRAASGRHWRITGKRFGCIPITRGAFQPRRRVAAVWASPRRWST